MKKILPIVLREGLRIDFCEPKGKGKLLNYIRFEYLDADDNTPTYLGSIDRLEKAELRKLKAVIVQ